uniref:Uncharacterized protein n=1 Tax=Vitis vinifera TaxID=29760 RepID=F6HWJ9_VITVI
MKNPTEKRASLRLRKQVREDILNRLRKGQCTPRKPHSSCLVLSHWRISQVKVLQKLEVQFPLVMNDDEDLTQLSGSKSTTRGRKRS